MDQSQDINAVTANDQSRISNQDELTTNYGINIRPHLPPPSSLGFWPTMPSHGLSPPEYPQHLQGYNPSLRHNGRQGHVIPSDAGPDHPLTPPRQDDEEQQLRRWHAQQNAQTPHEQRRLSYPAAPPDGYATPAAHQDYRSPFNIPRPRSEHASIEHSDGHYAPQPHVQNTYLNQSLPPDDALAQQWENHRLRTQGQSAYAQAPAPGHGDAPLQHHGQSGLPPVGIFRSSLPASYLPQSQASTADQYAPIDTTYGAPPQMTPPGQNTRPYDGPSPGHDGLKPPDKTALEKQEAYRRKGEEKRLERQAAATAKVQREPRVTSKGVKRRPSNLSRGMNATTLPPPLRQAHMSSGFHTFQVDDPFRTNRTASLYSLTYEYNYQQRMPLRPERKPSVPFGTPSWYSPMKKELDVQHYPVQPPLLKPDPDSLPQRIVDEYAEYKWSVTLYEIQSDQYDYAQSWLEDLFATNLTPDKYSWEAHTTCGFIQNSTRKSFVVLHNATDPFGYGSTESTTSIGVYGYYWYKHSEIHWKTFSPGLAWLLDWCVEQNGISVKQKWSVNMPKASDRRFHRAYWLAANRLHLRQLLNHSKSMVDTPHDVPEEGQEDVFEVEEGDLTNEWDVDVKQAEEAWKKVLEDVEMNGDEGKDGYLHVITGRAGRE